MNSFDITLALLRSSLWETEAPSLSLDEGWWEEIYTISKTQGVHTLLPDAFRQGCVPPKLSLARWLYDVECAETSYRRVESVGKELSSVFSESGIRSVILKGVSVASLYPKPSHRLSGDVDFHFPDKDGFRRANRFAKRFSDLGTDSDGDTHYHYKGVVVEHHAGWTHLSSLKARSMKANLEGDTLSCEDTLLLLSSHVLRHALVGGVGLRQLADLAVATRAFDGRYDKNEFRERISDLGLSKWAGLLSCVMKVHFGVPVCELPCVPDPKYCSRFMDLVKFDGDLGNEGRGLFAGFFRRMRLFVPVAPKEYFGRYFSLVFGRTLRVLGIGIK